MIDIPDDIFYHGYDRNVNLVEFSRRYLVEHQEQPNDLNEDKYNVLKFFLTTTATMPSSTNHNLFIKFAQRNRTYFVDYERNRFCLLDSDRKNAR